MLTYEQQTEKLLSKRQAVLDRIESDKAEIEKINAKLNAIQLAKIRDALSYHKSIKQQQNEGKKEKAKPSLYMRRDRQAKEKVRYE